MHLASTLFKDNAPKKEEYLHKALEILEFGAHNFKGRRCTFLGGDAGNDILSLTCTLFYLYHGELSLS